MSIHSAYMDKRIGRHRNIITLRVEEENLLLF